MAKDNVTIFDSRDEAIAVLRELKRQGIPSSSITVMSSEPLHIETAGSPSRIKGFAIAGGFVGAIFAVLLTVLTSRRVDIVTGGMPIVSPWAFGIIVFELSALGAILFTLGRMIVESRLLRRTAPSGYGDAVAGGKIVVVVSAEE